MIQAGGHRACLEELKEALLLRTLTILSTAALEQTPFALRRARF